MKHERRSRHLMQLAASAAAIAVLAGSMGAPATVWAQTPASAAPSQAWAQSQSDIPVDSNIRFGVLPNGMHYAIMHNATPPGQASLRLHFNAGSLMERDDQLGLAHFMEHMAFNGTTHIPKKDLIAILERLGLAFGADLNAATSYDQTFYMLDLPKTDEQTLTTGLFVLREQGSEALMKQDDINSERGVIRGEERLRNTPQSRASNKLMAILAKGQKIPDRIPIGDMKIIDTAPRQLFVDFYNAYYRPSRATLIAVGDFDVDAMEAKIRTIYSSWTPKAPDGPNPDLGAVAHHTPETHLIVEPGLSLGVERTWVSPPDLRTDTVALRREKLLRSLGQAVLNRRLGELSRTDNPPFSDAASSETDLLHSLHLINVTAQAFPGKWKQALEAVDLAQRQLVEFGVTQPELQREINSMRTRRRAAVEEAKTRDTRQLANTVLFSVNSREVVTTPQTDLDLFEDAVKGVTPEQVNAMLKTMFVGEGPITTLSSPTEIEGGEAALTTAINTYEAEPVTAPTPPVKLAWPYTNFGPTGQVVNRKELASIGATIVTFANGAVLTVKPTDFAKDEVSIGLLTGNGERSFSSTQIDPRATLVTTMTMGGLKKLSFDEMSRSLNGHMVGVSLSTIGDRFDLSGGTPGEDLQLEMQLMAAYLTDSAYRTAPFETAKASYPLTLEFLRATPGGAFELASSELLAGGDKRKAVLTPQQYESWSMDSMRDSVKSLLTGGPIHITMVGDVTVDRAIEVTANTFGALPPRPPAEPPAPGSDVRRFPAPTPTPLHFKHNGVAEQGLGYIAWPTTDAIGARAPARRLALLAAVLRLRALDEIRAKQALAYSPGVTSSFSDTYKDYGYIALEAQTTPQNLPAFFKAGDDIARSLRETPISEDELKRAREPMIAALKRGRNDNAWWMGNLIYIVDRPNYMNDILTGISDLETVTPADIQKLAQQYLRTETAWRADVTPSQTDGGAK